MSPTKTTLVRKIKSRSSIRTVQTPVIEVSEQATLKAKKALEIELTEEPITLAVEEKPEEDSPVLAEDAEEIAAEEVSLDDDELNPFGDKWEQ